MINKSFQVLRTNPALTTNVKLVVSSNYKLFLESIESEEFLNQNRFKRFQLNKTNLLNNKIPKFFENIPEDIAYYVKYDNDNSLFFNTFDQQIDPIYFSGSRSVIDKKHEEEFEYLAPLHINPSHIPSNFIIFRIDGPGIKNVNNTNFNSEILNNLKVVKLFDLVNTDLGEFLNTNFNNKYFPSAPLEIDFREFEFSKWNGIDYLSGGFSSKSLFLSDVFKRELPFSEFDKILTEGFKNNSVIYPNLLNLTFLFDDTPADPIKIKKYSINRYLGFYLDSLDIVEKVTPFKTYQLIDSGEIKQNIFYNSIESKNYDPIEGGWKNDKQYFVWNNGKFHLLIRSLIGIDEYEYKIISDEIFDTNINPLHTTDLFNEINTNKYTIEINYNDAKKRSELTLLDKTSFESTLNINEFNKADVHIIKINNKYHTLNYDSIDDQYYIQTDYKIIANTYNIKYWIDGEDSEYTTNIKLGSNNKQNTPPIFEIYKINFTNICDFDNTIKETKFAGYEYENINLLDNIDSTKEGKFYPNDYNLTNYESDLITDNPCSSEYIASDEYFSLDKVNELSQLWRKNPTICKWGFSGSISHNDYPYRANNQISNIDRYNRAPNPFLLDSGSRSSNNLDYFYTFGVPDKKYINHSLHIDMTFFNYLHYLNPNFDYFTDFFESEIITKDSNNNYINNSNKYSIFSGGSSESPATCVFRGAKFKICDVSNILKDSEDNIKEFSLTETNKYNNYKFSIILGEKRNNPKDDFAYFLYNDNDLKKSGIDVFVNHKFKNVLVHIYINSLNSIDEVYKKERDYLYTTNDISYSNNLKVESLIFSNFINTLNGFNNKNGFDNYLNYYVINKDGSFDYNQLNNKTTYDLNNIPPFHLSVEYPDEFEVILDSLKIEVLSGPKIETNKKLLYPNDKQPLSRKFIYDNVDIEESNIDSRGSFPNVTHINRFSGQHMPIFNIVNLFTSNSKGNYKFKPNLLDFGLVKEQKINKVNRFENLLKLKDQKNILSVYTMIDEFGYSLNDMFIFKSTWDENYYKETINDNDNDPVIPNNYKSSYLANEFKQIPINGTFNMKEHKSFLGSKSMNIEDVLLIDDRIISFSENSLNGEQYSNNNSETVNYDYNLSNLKKLNHTIEKLNIQTELESKEITKWIIKIDIFKLLEDYLYASIKKSRSFVDIKNINTLSNSVNLSIKEYIDLNLKDRYTIERIDFYVQYFSIEDNPSLKRYDSKYNLNVKNNSNKTNNINVKDSILNNDLEIEYTQSKNSLDYKYDYYFDVIFKRL